YGADFLWIDEDRIRTREIARDVVVLERREWGDFYGFLRSVRDGDRLLAEGDGATPVLRSEIAAATALHERIERIETDDIGAVNDAQEAVRLRLRRLELDGVTEGPEVEALEAESA